ncbi:GIY-YIG nuclease family protein [Qingshengfaniella alkalisoli]|uniref:GIY-YIG nuclease family protein n=1 Tax=Qingshengfaniella alkalisoli TaxID=2599296 RepID=A0A5B8I5Y0_9RHOB|nr:GIY-YIG nuclease family protein [Qingshengfaniella alkalisoli]QDY68815.1 GIY-YIG nuclease family protein [Qingshengfaniella alkalisoli]
MLHGRSVRIFLADGSATGILTAEIVNWTGQVVSAPRTRIETALKFDELKRTGVYLLVGFEAGNELPSVYVGEGDEISKRLNRHSKDEHKDFWESFVAVTSKDMNLTKAHARYLEGRLITLLKEAKKCHVLNKTDPPFDKLPKADISDMDAFVGELGLLLPVVGVDFLRKPRQTSMDGLPSVSTTRFQLHHSSKGIHASAEELDGEFVILQGSTGSLNESVSFDEKRQAFRQQVFESGRAEKIDASTFRLLDDVACSSPTAAAVFLFGTSRNGRTDWLVSGSSTTYGEWKSQFLEPETD